jgi:hypothetical protein
MDVYLMTRTKYGYTLGIGILALALLSVTVADSYAAPGNTFARADPEPYILGSGPLDCVGLTDIAEVASIDCAFFDDDSCPVGPNVPCATGSDNTSTAPPTFSPVPGACAVGCKEFRVQFQGTEDPTPTIGEEWHFRITFLNSDGQPISEQGKDVRTHSFFVLPESAIGTIAMVGVSAAIFGGFLGLRRYRSRI